VDMVTWAGRYVRFRLEPTMASSPPAARGSAISSTSRFSPATNTKPAFLVFYLAEDHQVALFEVGAMLGSPLYGVSVANPHQAWVLVTRTSLTIFSQNPKPTPIISDDELPPSSKPGRRASTPPTGQNQPGWRRDPAPQLVPATMHAAPQTSLDAKCHVSRGCLPVVANGHPALLACWRSQLPKGSIVSPVGPGK
jgi:hypothetical protein